MRRTVTLLLVLCTLLLCLSGCQTDSNRQEEFYLYYVPTGYGELDSALATSLWEGEQEVELLFQQLCTAPVGEELESLIPSRTSLKDWYLENGVLYLKLSGDYGTLTGIQLTMASYCIVLTLCQLEGVQAVSITADGEQLMEQELLSPQQVLLDAGEGSTVTLSLRLYFPLSDGSGIGSELRELTITENRSRLESVLDALCAGAEEKSLSAFLPDSAQGVTLWVQEGICYVNLTEEWKLELEADWDSLLEKLQCVVSSLCQLDEVESVQFLMDGAVLEDWSELGGDFPLSYDSTTAEEELPADNLQE